MCVVMPPEAATPFCVSHGVLDSVLRRNIASSGSLMPDIRLNRGDHWG
jgi:hypothetical protein